MKNKLLPGLLLLTLLATGCDRDPFPLDVERFDVYWYDGDKSGTRTPKDELDFDVRVNTTDPDSEDQYITDWELSYTANGKYVSVLQSDHGIHTNSLTFKGTVAIWNLALPWSGGLRPGDQIEFEFRATDNHGTQETRYYLYTLE